ncbi:MAG: hypothetical protein ACR2HN_07240 [Tepidiformaceae bacterium]
MATTTKLAFRERLGAFLAGTETSAHFRDWFVGAEWDLAHLGGSARPLAAGIEHAFAEYSSGVTSEADLRRQLAQLCSAS